MTLNARWILPLGIAAALLQTGCASAKRSGQLASVASQRPLLDLEHDFHRFVATRLARSASGEHLDANGALANLDGQVAALEALRMRYLDVVERSDSPRQQVLAMLRIAELHMDLGARIRRLPYPPDLTNAQKRAFDQRLGRLAVPYEAVGRGVLEQVVDLAKRQRMHNRYVARAKLYLALHGSRVQALGRLERATLKAERANPGPFGPPRRLLNFGRVGLRAARL